MTKFKRRSETEIRNRIGILQRILNGFIEDRQAIMNTLKENWTQEINEIMRLNREIDKLEFGINNLLWVLSEYKFASDY